MQTETRKNILKFMAVRPVQAAPAEATRLGILRRPAELASPFFQSVEKASTWREAQTLAKRYLETSGYPGAWGTTHSGLSLLDELHSAMVRTVQVRDAGILRSAWTALQPRVQTVKASDTRVRLWDCLLAAYYSPRTAAMDRGTIINALRAFQAIDLIQSLKEPADIAKLLRATPVLPVWASRSKKTTSGSPEPPTPVPVKFDPEINIKRREVVAIDETLDAVDLATKLTTRELARQAQVPQTPGEVVYSDAPQTMMSGATLASRLTSAQTDTLDAHDKNWRLKTPEEVSEGLQQKRAGLVTSLESAGGRAATAGMRTKTSEALRKKPDLEAEPAEPPAEEKGFKSSISGSVGSVRPLGVGDLIVAEETLIGYQETEISYIENVMATESRERVFRQLNRVTTTTSIATETVEETQRDLQSSTRNEVSAEMAKTVQTDVAINTGVNVSGGFGPVVEVDTNADFALSTSTATSTANATNFVQELVDNTVSRVTQSMREETVQEIVTETEETNRHSFNNSGPDHKIGIYRWLEKMYRVQLVNYGRRLMFELVVPEPSAFYKHARDNKAVTNVTLTRPVPLPADFSYEEITPSSYGEWVDRYRVPNVAPPPTESITLGKVLEVGEVRHAPKESDYVVTTKSDSIDIPEGYLAKECWVRGAWVIYSNQNENKQISATKLIIVTGRHPINKIAGDVYTELNDEERLLPLSVVAYNIAAYTLNVEISCKRKSTTLQAWKMDVFKKVVDAYNAQLTAYNSQLESKRVAQTSTLSALSPELKRGVEATELKRGCLELITGQHFYDFDATVKAGPYGYPEFRIKQAMEEGPYASFFEQCFEWEQMTYVFSPYFWGRKSKWIANSTESDSDSIFEAFLRAGSARVLLPVRRSWEKAVLYYLDTSEIWNGGEAPTVDDELSASIALESADGSELTPDTGRPIGEAWTYTLPTTLVKLQADATLPSWPVKP